MKLEKMLEVKNKKGLHARPAAHLAKMLAKTPSIVYFTCNSKTVDAKQIMNLLVLEATHSSKVQVSVEGEDAPSILKQISQYFESQFGERD